MGTGEAGLTEADPAGVPEVAPRVVAAAARGDRRALAEVLTVVRRLALPYCRARLGPGALAGVSAEDLAQDVCMRVLAALPRYSEQGRPFAAFVYVVAANAVADVRRRAIRRPVEPLAEHHDAPDPAHGPLDLAERSELRRALRAAVATLPPRLREVLVLRVPLGLSVEQTALLLGISRGAVRLAQHRALTRLRRSADVHSLADERLRA